MVVLDHLFWYMTISLTTTSHPQVFPNECAFTIVGFLALAIFITLLINTICHCCTKKYDCKIAKTAREAAVAQPPTFCDKDNNNACLHNGGQAYGNVAHSEIFFFFLFFHCLDYPWSCLPAWADHLPPAQKLLEKVKIWHLNFSFTSWYYLIRLVVLLRMS